MPRYARNDDGDIYRVVVTTEWSSTGEGSPASHTQHYGPYGTLQAAKTQASRHQRQDGYYSYGGRIRNTTAKVQRTAVQWEDVN